MNDLSYIIDMAFSIFGALFPFIVAAIVIFAIVKKTKVKKVINNYTGPISNKKSNSVTNKSSYSGKLQVSADLFFEDRENDWLAKQMKEERKIKNKTMTDLGAIHDRNCEAREIKTAHEKAHSKYNYRRRPM